MATLYPVNPGMVVCLCLGSETAPYTKSMKDLGLGLVSLLIEQHPELMADQTIHLPEVSPENPSPVSPLLLSMWENLCRAPRDKPVVNVMSGGRSTETREIRRIIHEHSEHINMFRNIHCYKDVKKVSTGCNAESSHKARDHHTFPLPPVETGPSHCGPYLQSRASKLWPSMGSEGRPKWSYSMETKDSKEELAFLDVQTYSQGLNGSWTLFQGQ